MLTSNRCCSPRLPPPAELEVLRVTRTNLELQLRKKYGAAPRFYYGGSYGKDTLIRASYDLDIIVYFPHTDTTPLRDVYGGVFHTLKNGGLIVQPKTVAIRLPYQAGFHIDIVPGRAQDATFRYATLYKNPGSTLQTSLKVHIEAVRRSGVRDIVRLIKLWRLRQNLSWGTFALEIVVTRALAGKPVIDYSTSVVGVWRFIEGNLGSIRLIDPANTNNEITMSAVERAAIIRAATASLAARTWQEVIW